MKRLALSTLLLTGCFNLTGANKEAAELNAKSFSKDLGLDLKGVTCNRHDTDGDGYLSCTFAFTDGTVRTFECAGKSIIQDNSGCREPKLKLPTQVTVQD